MDTKPLKIFDQCESVSDNAIIKGTSIILKQTPSGKTIFRGHNKVILGGSEFNAQKGTLFDPSFEHTSSDDPSTCLKSYDYALSVPDALGVAHPLTIGDSTKYLAPPTGSTNNPLSVFANGAYDINTSSATRTLYEYFTRRVCLFAVGIDGCGIDNSRVFRVSNAKWIGAYSYASYNPGGGVIDDTVTNCLIPFKQMALTEDLTTEADRGTYFGRSVVDSTVSYYFKAFDQNPIIHYRWADGRGEIDPSTDVYKSTGVGEGEIVIELKMSIDPSDCREYFRAINANNSARINTISLCTAIPYEATDHSGPGTGNKYKYYRDIRPFTKFNFPNESLIDSSKGIEISYFLYF